MRVRNRADFRLNDTRTKPASCRFLMRLEDMKDLYRAKQEVRLRAMCFWAVVVDSSEPCAGEFDV